MIEERYYKLNEKMHASPHLFLFTEEPDGIKLTSYEIPTGYNKSTFTYQNLDSVDFNDLKLSKNLHLQYISKRMVCGKAVAQVCSHLY